VSIPKYDYVMDYIGDKDLFRAVMFARKMMRNGTEPAIAIRRAARYYDVDASDVGHYCAQVAGRINAERNGKQ